jgi:hypothetical protein
MSITRIKWIFFYSFHISKEEIIDANDDVMVTLF